MNISTGFLVCVATLVFSHASFAEIYETTDAQGNKVFTDTPTNVGGKSVELTTTNIADPVKDMPQSTSRAAPKTATPAPAGQEQGESQGDVVIIGDARNDRLEREVVEHRRQEVLGVEKRHAEGGENLSATHREFPEHAKPAHPVAHPHPGGRR